MSAPVGKKINPFGKPIAGLFVLLVLGFTPAWGVVGPTRQGDALASSVIMLLTRQGISAGFCSGVIIAKDVILTAAHCVVRRDDMRLLYKDASGAPIMLRIARVKVHPDFHADAQASRVRTIDLALVQSATALPAMFQSATLDGVGSVAPGKVFEIAGFGMAQEAHPETTGNLRIGTIIARLPLSKVLLWTKDSHGNGVGACAGDSGAPIFDVTLAKVVAITAWADGRGNRLCGAFTQGTLVAPQLGWIEKTLHGWSAEPRR